MPIRSENKDRYPRDWHKISHRIRAKADWRCEWCGAAQNQLNPKTGSKVILTVAHLNHMPEDCRDENLVALCQSCHLGYDKEHHERSRARNRYGKYVLGDSYVDHYKLPFEE
jgi:hypothetical protein